ncbi:MAG: hypothetical protein ACLTX6_09880 [Lachnospiraceae bacterium]
MGIYMETEGVLVIDTRRDSLAKEGLQQEPAKNIVEAGDYIVAFNDQTVQQQKELMEDLSKFWTESGW